MQDLEIQLEKKPGMLALMGETLGKHSISLEGGGVFHNGSTCIAHFLVDDALSAKKVLENAGIKVLKINKVIIARLRQDVAGQLGTFCRRMAESNVNILTQYSDHSNNLIVIVDDFEKGKIVAAEWAIESEISSKNIS